MLPQLYQKQLLPQINAQNFYFLQLAIDLLQQVQPVKLETLAYELSLLMRAESRRKR